MPDILDESIGWISELEPGDVLYVARPGAPSGQRNKKIEASDLLNQMRTLPSGNTASRPEDPPVGTIYLDTEVGSLVWWNGSSWQTL